MRLPQTRQRGFTSVLSRYLLVRTLGFAAFAVTLLVGNTLGTSLTSHDLALPLEQHPSWTTADAATFDGCVAWTTWPRDQIPSALVVQRYRDDAHVRLAFDRAWRLNHNATEVDDVAVLGGCS